MADTAFTTITDQLTGDEWPDGQHDIVTVITGDLADKLRAYHGLTGQVEIHQHGDESGYSEWTVEWDWEAWLTIGGQKVGPPNHCGWSEVEDWALAIERQKGTWRANQIAQHLLKVGGTDA